jgi:hypothetical protein
LCMLWPQDERRSGHIHRWDRGRARGMEAQPHVSLEGWAKLTVENRAQAVAGQEWAGREGGRERAGAGAEAGASPCTSRAGHGRARPGRSPQSGASLCTVFSSPPALHGLNPEIEIQGPHTRIDSYVGGVL